MDTLKDSLQNLFSSGQQQVFWQQGHQKIWVKYSKYQVNYSLKSFVQVCLINHQRVLELSQVL